MTDLTNSLGPGLLSKLLSFLNLTRPYLVPVPRAVVPSATCKAIPRSLPKVRLGTVKHRVFYHYTIPDRDFFWLCSNLGFEIGSMQGSSF